MRIIFVFKEIEDEQLGAMSLSAVLKAHGHHTQAVQAEYDLLAEKLKDGVPTILAFSVIAYYIDYYLSLNLKLKERFKFFSIFGGYYPTMRPEVIEEEGLDAVCIGEGEEALAELADNLGQGKDVREIRNLWVKQGGTIFKNALRPLITDLDNIPFADRNLFKEKSPFFYNRISMITSRGCTYSCPYCYNSAYDRLYNDRKNKYRRRSVTNVIQEIKATQKNQPVDFILFYDDIFVINEHWLEEFSYRYKKEINVPFACYVRINLISEKIVMLLKEANCYSVSFGIESGNEYVMNDILKRNLTNEQIISKSRLLKDYGIRIRTTNIIGIPGGSFSADLQTLKLNIQCKVDYAKVSFFSPYPRTDFDALTHCREDRFFHHLEFQPSRLLNFLSGYSLSATGHFQRLLFSLKYPQYGYATLPEKKYIGNLHNLFSFTASHSFLMPLIKILVKLPPNFIFTGINFLWGNYCSYFKLYPTCGPWGVMQGIFSHRKRLSNRNKRTPLLAEA